MALGVESHLHYVVLQAGYYCSVCDCILRDSQSYLDHINGKWHNRALGTSMRVERSTADAAWPLPLFASMSSSRMVGTS